MVFNRGMPSLVEAANMTGDPFVLVKALDDIAGDTHIDLFFNQVVGDAVVMSVHLDVVIDVYPGFFPLGKRIGCLRQGLQCRFVNG